MTSRLELDLRLRPRPGAGREPAAYLVAGADAATWLAEVAVWGVPAGDVRFYVLPAPRAARSLASPREIPGGLFQAAPPEPASPAAHAPRAAAVLAVPPPGARPTPGPRAQPYGRVGPVYLPADADLDPPATPGELADALPGHAYVFHPALGLVALEPGDARRVGELLGATPREAAWDRARPGAAPRPGLRVVEASTPGLEALLREGRGDIDSRPREELPPAPGEPPPPAPARRQLTRLAARALRWLTAPRARADRPRPPGPQQQQPGPGQGAAGPQQPPSRPGLLARLAAWAERHARPDAGADVGDARRREVARLLHLLDTDPDRGLRYALPVAGRGRSRGRAPPAARLPEREATYDPGRLGGGKPFDPWEVPFEQHLELVARYRALANRELALGRFRRAAYVFAELLGDDLAAASALQQGRCHREAAALYRQLDRPLQAAACLAAGGLLAEAAEVYAQVGEHVLAGDLLARLGRREDAVLSYRRSATELVARGDVVAAARLLVAKVDAPDEALGLLARAWPEHDQAEAALAAWFELAARLGRHDEAGRLLAQLSAARSSPRTTLRLARAAARVAATYPVAAVQARAADGVRRAAALRLADAGRVEAGELVQLLVGLAPADRLLARDGDRFLARRGAALPRPPARKRGAVLVREVRLGWHQTTWRAAAGGDALYLAGDQPERQLVHVGRMAWTGGQHHRPSELAWREPSAWRDGAAGPPPVLLAAGSSPGVGLVVCTALARTVRFPAGMGLPAVEVGRPGWLPAPVLALAWGELGLLWVVTHEADGLVLSALDAGRDGAVVATHALAERAPGDPAHGSPPSSPAAGPPPPVLVATRRDVVVVTVGARLHWLAAGTLGGERDLPAPARSLAASPPGTPPLVAVGLEEDAVALWGRSREVDRVTFAQGLSAPRVAFTADGLLAAVSQGEGRIYREHPGRLEPPLSFDVPQAPLAAVPTRTAGELAVVTDDGVVRVVRASP